MNEVINIPDGWVETTLNEYLDLLNGYAFKSDDFENEKIDKSYLPILKIKNVANGNANHNDVVFHKLNYNLEKYIIKEGDILIALTGNHPSAITQVVGGISRYYLKENALLNQRVGKIYSKNENILNNDFIYYFFKWNNTQFHIANQSSGSASQANISKNDVVSTPINLPPLTEQKSIAAILTAFDNKIELLQTQNKTLEETAQTIFAEWFGKYSIEDELPEGWRVGKLGEVTKTYGGTTPSTTNPDFWDGDIHWTSPKDLSNSKGIFLLNTDKKITKEGLKKISSGLLPKRTLLLSSRAPIGYLALTNIELAINQGYIAIVPEQYFSNNFMYLWLTENMKLVENASNGSTFMEISKSSFRNIDCVIPNKEILEKFDNFINPTFEKVLSNLIQIQTLTKTRDEILPRLMSGEVRVSEL